MIAKNHISKFPFYLAGRHLLFVLISMLLPFLAGCSEKQMNVLFIMADDLKPLAGCYGDPLVKTPNMDVLAAEGFLFEQAACQYPLCAPSRASILTGLRPETLQCFQNKHRFRDKLPDIITLPEAFRQAGYHTVSLGKVFDSRNPDPGAWDERYWVNVPFEYGDGAEMKLYALEENNRLFKENREQIRTANPAERRKLWTMGPAYESAPLDNLKYPEGLITERAIELLRQMKDKPFFFGIGFWKPHVPFVCPEKYWDLYSREDIRLAPNPDRPQNSLDIAYHEGFELRGYHGIPKAGKLDDELARTLIHGYYACTSFIDEMLGKILDELEALGLADNTIIVFMGDHGYHLGDKEIWCKMTAFQKSSLTPLIVVDPRRKGGQRVGSLVEFVDICPTLCELTGVNPPENLEGISFVPLLDEPSRDWKKAIFCQTSRGRNWEEFLGTSMRTEKYNYVEWRHRLNGSLQGRELYDLDADPLEMNNLAPLAEYSDLLDQLTKQMEAGWQGALPE